MAAKVDEKVFARIVELKIRYALTNKVISERLGISHSTVKAYLRANRTGLPPYKTKCTTPKS